MEQAARHQPVSVELAREHELRGELTQAARLWQDCLAKDPVDYNARLGYGRVLFLSEQYEAASSALRAAIEVKPDGAEALFFLSRACFEAGQLEQARDLFIQAVGLDPLLDHPVYREKLMGPAAVPGFRHESFATVESLSVPTINRHGSHNATTPHHSAAVTLRHFWGAHEYTRAIRQQVVERFAADDSYTPHSYLLFGPQDCGKQFLSRCVAGELGATVLELEGECLESVQAEAEVRDFLASTIPGKPKAITILRLEKLVTGSTRVRRGARGLPALLGFLAPIQEQQRVLVCFHSDVPWLLPRSLRTSPWFKPAFLLPPPDTQARHLLLEATFGDAIPAASRNFLVDRTDGFTTADLSALTMLMEQHIVARQQPSTEQLERSLKEDRSLIGPIDWKAAPGVVARVPPTSVEWFRQARRVRFQLHHPELVPFYDRLLTQPPKSRP